jgi:peroxiredoxin
VTSDEPESIGRVTQSKKITFSIVRDPEGTTMEAYGISAIPRTLIIDKDGIVQVDITGGEGIEQFKEKLKKVGL